MTDATDPLFREIEGPSPRQMLKARALKHKALIFGMTVVLLLVLVALLAPVLAPHDPYEQSLMNRMVKPVFMGGTWEHPLGTDHLGRDYLSRLIYGARVSLLIGAVAALISGVIGTAMGVAAGYFGGKVDAVVTFLINVRLAMPVVLVALAVVAILGGSLTVVICVLGLLLWDRFAVVMRASTLQVRRRDYVAAAQVIGASTPRIVLTEIMPNIFNNLIVVVTLEMAHAILLEAALSFLGLGVQPPTPSWGVILNDGYNFIRNSPWPVIGGSIPIILVTLGFTFMGEALRDIFDPKLRKAG